jgi:DNA processing protein
MDLHTAVSVSMLPGSRGRLAAAFKTIAAQQPGISLEDFLDTQPVPPDERGPMASAARDAAAVALARAPAVNACAIPWFDVGYPVLLACIHDPPPVLWVRGNPAALGRPMVAIVGSRAATPYAVEVAARLAADLASRGIVVASGLARGVDSSAHRGCLDGGGQTVAVLGSGVDRVYPAEHRHLAAMIADNGCVISELPPGAVPRPEHFPLRNRIISGISLGVVVVEASEKSGSLITARCALEQGRDVLAVPGSVLSGRNRGSHSLLKDGAKVVENADDILEELGWPSVRPQATPAGKSLIRDPLLARMEQGESYRLDDLVGATGVAPSELLTRLMELELRGLVRVVSPGRFALVAGDV